MIKLEVLVKPSVRDAIVERLVAVGVHSLSYGEVKAANRSLFHEFQGSDEIPPVDFATFVKIEVILDEAHLDSVEEALTEELCLRKMEEAEVVVIPLKEGLRLAPSPGGFSEITEI